MEGSTAPVATPTQAPTNQNIPPQPAEKSTPTQDSKISQNPQNSKSNSVANGSTPEAPKTPPEKEEVYDVRVNGKIIKMTRQQLLDNASMVHTANSRFDEAKKFRDEADAFKKALKSKPIDALFDPSLGHSKESIRAQMEEWYAREFIEPETLTEEQKKLKAAELELKTYKDNEIEETKKAEEAKLAEMTNQQRQHMQTQIIEALEKSNLPQKDPGVFKRVASYMRQNLLRGWEAPMDMIVRQVHKDLVGETQSLAKNCDSIEQLVDLFGEENVNRIRQWDLDNLRKKRNGFSSEEQAAPPPQQQRFSSADIDQRLRDIRTGKYKF